MKNVRFIFFVCLSALMMSVPLSAHHGTSVTYDVSKTMTLTGTVTEFSYSYPHPQLYFDVKDANGAIQHWGSEFGPTPLMMKNMNVGWSKASIKAGDAVTIICNPHKTPGATACLTKELVINGKKMPLGGGPPPGAQTSASKD
jgi:Family of unknown function (DUF6152)